MGTSQRRQRLFGHPHSAARSGLPAGVRLPPNKIASEDLKLRGPGDLFGIRQSGLMDFGLGDIYQDAAILQKANEAAEWLLKNNPEYVQQIPDYEGTSSVII